MLVREVIKGCKILSAKGAEVLQLEYREPICAGGCRVFAFFDGFGDHCCGEDFAVDI